MATHNISRGQAAVPQLKNMKFRDSILVDMSVIVPASGDVIQCINVVEGMFITDAFLIVVVAEGGAANVDVGDGSAVNGFDDAVSINSTAGTVTKSLEATDAYGVGRYYTGADTIDLVVNSSSVETAKVLLVVEGIYLDDPTLQSTL